MRISVTSLIGTTFEICFYCISFWLKATFHWFGANWKVFVWMSSLQPNVFVSNTIPIFLVCTSPVLTFQCLQMALLTNRCQNGVINWSIDEHRCALCSNCPEKQTANQYKSCLNVISNQISVVLEIIDKNIISLISEIRCGLLS